jgi:antitoxin ParD1/3/4
MARESTLNVSLTPALQSYIKSKVASGGYESASEVVRDGLRALQEREQATSQFWSDIRGKTKVARSAIAKGDVVDGRALMRSMVDGIQHKAAKRRTAKRRTRP